MAFDYTNLYPDTSGNGGYTKSWNYTTVTDSIATCSASGYFNKVATRLGIGDNIVIARVDAFPTSARTTLIEYATLYVSGIANGIVTTTPSTTGLATTTYVDAGDATVAANAAAATALKADIASPTFTNVPSAPTAAVNTSTTQIATTAFVIGQASDVTNGTPAMDGVAARGASVHFARADHVHPTDTSRAPLASPTFTGQATVSSASGGIGYSTGAGGTVTQATSKSTGVTLNAASGQITMNGAALAAGATVTFTLTNSSIAATDVVIPNIKSVATVGAYRHPSVDAIAAGSCQISITNGSGGSLSEAIVLQFVVIKGANA